MLNSLSNILKNLNGELNQDISMDSVNDLKSALLAFLNDTENLYHDMIYEDCEVDTDDLDSARQIIKLAGELYHSLR